MRSINVVTIDPSTACTGVCINGALFCFSDREYSTTKKGNLTKWFEIASDACDVLLYDTPPNNTKNTKLSFSESEVYKLLKYDFITDKIIDIISTNTDRKKATKCLIEGYSYNSAAGNLIDLVTYSTLLRHKLWKRGVCINVIPPASLKLGAAKLTYPPKDIGKKKPKLEWRNKQGIAAGSFKKPEIYKVITENPTLTDAWSELLRVYESHQLNATSISKPIDDINDSYVLYHSYMAGHLTPSPP